MNVVFNEEKEYLEYVKNCLLKEIEYSKKEMKEIPKRHTNVLQGDTFLVESLMSLEATKLRRLVLAKECPYFGRIDFVPNGSNSKTRIYIGKTNVNGENNVPVVTDWRSPICSLYYDSELGPVSYEAPTGIVDGSLELKRQIIIKDGELEDAFDTSLVSNDDLLQPYLSNSVDNKMKTIVASIQKEQNAIIRMPITKNIIVQGVAGSGKTSVALHRIAYLAYNLGDKIKSNQFLVIGPNKYFLNYISSILPELDTEPVTQQTYFDLIASMLKEKISLEASDSVFDKKNSKVDMKKINAFKSSLEYKDILIKFMNDYLNEIFVSNGFSIDDTEIYSASEIKKIIFSGVTTKLDFDGACTYFVKKFKNDIEDIYAKLNKKYRDIYINLPKDDPRRKEAIEKSTELSKLLREKGVKLLKEYFKKLKLSSIDVYKLFIENIWQYDNSLSVNEVDELQKSTLAYLRKKKVMFEDLAALMYIDLMLNGNSTKYKHIVIDEAQDYGMFHFDILKEYFPGSTFSIYGDLAQSIYSYRGIKDWESVISLIFNDDCDLLNLSKSYRTTIEITNNANKVLRNLNLNQAEPVIRHGEVTTFNDCSNNNDYKLSKILEWLEKGYKTIAVICKTDKEALSVYKSLSEMGVDVTHITAKNEEYKGRVFVLTSALSKGLEFDAVIINDASSNVYDSDISSDMHLLYVACTRALHELDILYNKKLCSVFGIENIKKNENVKKLVKR